jgi:hypothetical protein
MSEVRDVVDKFNVLDASLKKAFSKVHPLLVVSLIFDRNANKEDIYTIEVVLKRGRNTEELRERVIARTGMSPGFYLQGTKMIVSHALDLELLKLINDLDFVESIKGSKYGAGGSSDF